MGHLVKGQVLKGCTVIEGASLVAGPYCGRILAALGASVVKVEDPGCGDPARRRGIPSGKPGQTGSLFLYVNAGKRGITLDLRQRRGRQILQELLLRADVFIQDEGLFVWGRRGLSFKRLQQGNPRLVVVSITPFGAWGPHSRYKVYHLNTYHAGGEGYMLPGGPDHLERPPVQAGGYLGEYDAGIAAAVGVLAALYYRALTEKGQHIDISKQEACISVNRFEIGRYTWDGIVESRAYRSARPAGTCPTKDGWVQMTAGSDRMWQNLLDAMGNPAWARDERFQNRGMPPEHAVELNKHIHRWTSGFTREELISLLRAKDVPVAPVNTAEGILKAEQLRSRGFFQPLCHSEAGEMAYPTFPYRFSESPPAIETPAPRLGEHNDEVYRHLLGYEEGQLVRLQQTGVI